MATFALCTYIVLVPGISQTMSAVWVHNVLFLEFQKLG